MASKCWFVLSHTHYPPPTLPEHGFGRSSGPLCLGHMIPDIRHLDNVINRDGPLDNPPNMPIHTTKASGTEWQLHHTSEIGFNANTGVPIATAVGLTLKLDAGSAFRSTISNFWEFESLETFIIQPNNAYVEESLEAEEVANYLERRGLLRSSNLFMITGIIVARGATVRTAKSQGRDVGGGPAIELPTIAEIGTRVGLSMGKSSMSSALKTTDFVWAIRLARISRGFLDRRWSFETVSRGATFSLNEELDLSTEATEALAEEGIDIRECEFKLGVDDEIFVLGSDIA